MTARNVVQPLPISTEQAARFILHVYEDRAASATIDAFLRSEWQEPWWRFYKKLFASAEKAVKNGRGTFKLWTVTVDEAGAAWRFILMRYVFETVDSFPVDRSVFVAATSISSAIVVHAFKPAGRKPRTIRESEDILERLSEPRERGTIKADLVGGSARKMIQAQADDAAVIRPAAAAFAAGCQRAGFDFPADLVERGILELHRRYGMLPEKLSIPGEA